MEPPGPADDLDELARELAALWSLRLGSRYPSGTGSWVAAARTAGGEPAVLKIGRPHAEARDEADGLLAWAGRGTIRLLARQDLPATGAAGESGGPLTALLLEACEPGTPLDGALLAEDQDEVVAGLLARMRTEPASGHTFRPLAQMCAQWAEEFERDYAAALAGGEPRLDPGLARAGARLFRELPGTAAGPAVLLATDLHHGNVLAARREPWLVIDPKPYAGDPAYDALQHMINFPGRLTSDPGAFTARMAGLLGVDPVRLRLWLFARCAVESVADPALRLAATLLAP